MTRGFSKIVYSAVVLAALTAPLHADEVSDALQAAGEAYSAGDLAKTKTQIALAMQAINLQQSARLEALMPAAPDGWTRTLTEDFAQGFAIMGGGAGVEARYENADQSVSFTMSMIADNPMVASMGAMLGNAQMMAMMGKVAMVGDQPVLDSDGSLSSLVNARVLFQAQGATSDEMMPLIKTIDFAKVGVFDSN